MRLVYVHLGNYYPRWLIPNCIDQMGSFGRSVAIVSDNERILRAAESKRVPVWRYVGDPTDMSLRQASTERDLFRGGFWLETSRRFIALEEFQRALNEPILHVESDVVVFPSLDPSSFTKLHEGMAFALINATHGVGTLIYSEQASQMKKLTETLAHSRAQNRTVTDMQVLGSLAQDPDGGVAILPTSSRAIPIVRYGVEESLRLALSARDLLFGGIFDAATIGQYLFGLDSRNHRGKRLLYTVPVDHVVDPRLAKFRLEGDQLLMEAQEGGEQVPVHCLHVHSKDLRAFSNLDRRRLLEHRIARSNRGETAEWDTWGLLSSVRDAAAYRWRSTLHYHRRPRSAVNEAEEPKP